MITPQAHQTFAPFIPSQVDALDDLRVKLATAHDVVERSQIQVQIEQAENLEARRERAEAERERERAAKQVEAVAREQAAKARWLQARGELKSGIEIGAEQARRSVMARLVSEASVQLAFQEIAARKLHPVHSKALLAAYVDELRSSQPELAPHLDRCELPTFAPNLAELDRELPPYQPPPPPAPTWPAPVEGYVKAALAAIDEIYGQRASATWVQVKGGLAPMAEDVYGTANRRGNVQRVVERGARLAWAPMPGRVVPPALSEGSWQPLADGSGWVFEAPALEKGSK